MEDTPKDEPTTPIETPPEKSEEAAVEAKPEEAQASKTPPPPTPPPVVKKPRKAYTGTEIALIIVSIVAVLLLISTIAMAVCGAERFERGGKFGHGRMGQRSEKGQDGWQNYRQQQNGYSPRMMPRFQQQQSAPVPQGQSAPMPQLQTPPTPGQSP
jgi:hypothetical protein